MKIKLTREELNYYSECIKYCTVKDSIGILESSQIKFILEYDDKQLVERYLSETGSYISRHILRNIGRTLKLKKGLLKVRLPELKNELVKMSHTIETLEKMQMDKTLDRVARKKIAEKATEIKAQQVWVRSDIRGVEDDLYNISKLMTSRIKKWIAAYLTTGAAAAGGVKYKQMKDAEKEMEAAKQASKITKNSTAEEIKKSIEANKSYKEAFKKFLSNSREILLKALSEKGVKREASVAIVSALFFAAGIVFVYASVELVKKIMPIIKKLIASVGALFVGKKVNPQEGKKAKEVVKKLATAK